MKARSNRYMQTYQVVMRKNYTINNNIMTEDGKNGYIEQKYMYVNICTKNQMRKFSGTWASPMCNPLKLAGNSSINEAKACPFRSPDDWQPVKLLS